MRSSKCVFALVHSLVVMMPCHAIETDIIATIEDVPLIDGWRYRTLDLVRVVNQLRRLGKQQSLTAMKEYAQREKYDEDSIQRIWLICYCLFENEGSWPKNHFGAPVPANTGEVSKKLATFPIVQSKGVPFLLVVGYRLGGRSGPPDQLLELCERLPLIKADLPTRGHFAAARELIDSTEFVELYSDELDREELSEMIMNQACICN